MEQQLFLFDEVEQVEEPVVQDSTIHAFSGLLSKFDAIELSGEQRISEEELEYCQLQEQIFFETCNTLKQAMVDISSLYAKYKDVDTHRNVYDGANYLSYYSDVEVYPKRIKEIYERFVSRITYYFTEKYKVSLSSEEIIKKYDENTISYSLILDEIFEQLGGLTFKEKAVTEIKAASKKTVYRADKVSIAKNKLSITDFVWWQTSWDNSLSVSYDDRAVRPLFMALSHFMTGNVDMTHSLQNIYQQLKRGSKDYDIYAKFELPHDVLQAIKFYKNGKVDLFFADNSQAETFKKEYLV